MNSFFVVIITGPPDSGKTVLGKRLAQELRLPFINKDDIKEILFDILGWEDRQMRIRLGQAGFEILFHFLECQLEARQSAIVETAFIPKYHNARFLSLRDRYDFEPVQILCNADDRVLFERFIERTESGERHPGHMDHLTSYEQFAERLQERKYQQALMIGGSLLEIDTTDFDTVDFEGLIRAIHT